MSAVSIPLYFVIVSSRGSPSRSSAVMRTLGATARIAVSRVTLRAAYLGQCNSR